MRHHCVHSLKLLQGFPSAILGTPLFRIKGEPDGKGFGEIFVGMSLSVPVAQMPDKALLYGRGRYVSGWYSTSRSPNAAIQALVDEN